VSGPGWREPALATLTDRRFSDEDWIFERKLDGVRAICVRDSGTPTLYSRNRKVMDNACPELVEALEARGGPRFVADGEIVAFDGAVTSFAALQPRIHVSDPGRARATGARHGFGALLLGYHENGGLEYAGKVGTGFDEKLLASLLARLRELETSRSPFAGPVKERGAHWVRPDLVAQIDFSEWTRDGRLRHPRFAGLREDKKAADVVRERA
jgi:ATP-dependent DNA ligase